MSNSVCVTLEVGSGFVCLVFFVVKPLKFMCLLVAFFGTTSSLAAHNQAVDADFPGIGPTLLILFLR